MKIVLLFLAGVAIAACKPASGDADVTNSVIGVVKSCSEEDVSLCLKVCCDSVLSVPNGSQIEQRQLPGERALKYVENLASSRELNIYDGISLLGTGSPRSARSFEPLSEEPKARENQIESRLVDAAADFLENHVIQLRVPKSTVEDVKRSLEEGRGKKKKLKALIPIYALLQLKIQALIPLFLGIIAFAAVKGLLLAKAALLASALILLKKLLSKHESHESYEVVQHPHHEEHFSHGGGGHAAWGRSADAQNLAYKAYAS